MGNTSVSALSLRSAYSICWPSLIIPVVSMGKGCAGRLHYSTAMPCLIILASPLSPAVFHSSCSQHLFSWPNLEAVDRLELAEIRADWQSILSPCFRGVWNYHSPFFLTVAVFQKGKSWQWFFPLCWPREQLCHTVFLLCHFSTWTNSAVFKYSRKKRGS